MGFRVWGRGFWGFIPLRGLTFLPHHAKDVIKYDSGFKVEDDSVHRYSLSFPVRNMLAALNVMKWSRAHRTSERIEGRRFRGFVA